MVYCIAKTRNGNRCLRVRAIGSFCAQHSCYVPDLKRKLKKIQDEIKTEINRCEELITKGDKNAQIK